MSNFNGRKRFFTAWFIIYVLNSVTGYCIHDIILGKTYKAIAATLHADVKSRLWAFIIISITGSFFFTFIYSVWRKKNTIAEGLQYGLFIGCWITLSTYLGAYASSDAIPFSLVIKWVVLGILQYTLAGYVLATLYNYKKASNSLR